LGRLIPPHRDTTMMRVRDALAATTILPQREDSPRVSSSF